MIFDLPKLNIIFAPQAADQGVVGASHPRRRPYASLVLGTLNVFEGLVQVGGKVKSFFKWLSQAHGFSHD